MKTLKPPVDAPTKRPDVLAVHAGAGITKRKGKGQAPSRNKRLRQEKGALRAEAFMDKTESKVVKGFEKIKVVKERSVRLRAFSWSCRAD